MSKMSLPFFDYSQAAGYFAPSGTVKAIIRIDFLMLSFC